MIGDLVKASLPLLAGVCATLGWVHSTLRKPGVKPQVDEYWKKYGVLHKVGGPVLILVGLIQVLRVLYGQR